MKFLFKEFSAGRMDGVEIYADLEGHRINGVTIPPDVAMTGQKPDLVIIKRKTDPPEVRLVELTVPWDTTANIDGALKRKTERYEALTNDIKGNGFKCFNLPLEVGTRELVTGRNKGVITTLCHAMGIKKISKVARSCSKLALLGSYTIWNARYSADWSGGGYLQP